MDRFMPREGDEAAMHAGAPAFSMAGGFAAAGARAGAPPFSMPRGHGHPGVHSGGAPPISAGYMHGRPGMVPMRRAGMPAAASAMPRMPVTSALPAGAYSPISIGSYMPPAAMGVSPAAPPGAPSASAAASAGGRPAAGRESLPFDMSDFPALAGGSAGGGAADGKPAVGAAGAHSEPAFALHAEDFPALGGGGSSSAGGGSNGGAAAAAGLPAGAAGAHASAAGSAAPVAAGGVGSAAAGEAGGSGGRAAGRPPAAAGGAAAAGAAASSLQPKVDPRYVAFGRGAASPGLRGGAPGGGHGGRHAVPSPGRRRDGAAAGGGGAAGGGAAGGGAAGGGGGAGSSGMERAPGGASARPAAGGGGGSSSAGGGGGLGGDATRAAGSERGEGTTGTDKERYGLMGLLSVIRMTDPDLNTLALGIDLTTLGLNLNSPESLYATFASPWADKPSAADPEFCLPQCYYQQPPVLKTSHFRKFQLESLFYIFYAMPRDVMQAYAAEELYRRDWRYHTELKLWFSRATQLDGQVQYIFFDINAWKSRIFSGTLTPSFMPKEEVGAKRG
eukprot:PLAT6362.1.p1 GENE.PLAT6362.1~~PLAT6362.1.p1  ORF type:complete len:590 (-),score=218.67 PLAT6362.1:93-1769(-)